MLKCICIFFEISCILVPVLCVFDIIENIQMKKIKKASKLREYRKQSFNRDCERAGNKLRTMDIVKENEIKSKSNQQIKYTGLFSGIMLNGCDDFE